jgi:hypothetical protein
MVVALANDQSWGTSNTAKDGWTTLTADGNHLPILNTILRLVDGKPEYINTH